MGFNLTIFIAQLINFFLLIWLLKRLLYRPILDVIEKRQQQITQNITEAENKLSSAAVLETQLKQEKEEFDKQSQKRLNQIEDDFKKQQQALQKDLEQAYYLKQANLQKELNQSWLNAEQQIQKELETEFIALAQKVLTEWSDQTSTDMVLNLFYKQVENLSKSTQKTIQALLAKQPLISITTSKTLTAKQKEEIRQKLSTMLTLPPKTRFHFQTKASLILGLEVRIDTYLLSWNLNTYLEEITQRLRNNVTTLICPSDRKANQ